MFHTPSPRGTPPPERAMNRDRGGRTRNGRFRRSPPYWPEGVMVRNDPTASGRIPA